MTRALDELAAQFLRHGKTPRWVTDATGLSIARVESIAKTLARPCADPEHCGYAQLGAGHPRRGWINVRSPGQKGVWCCSWACVASFAQRRLTAKVAG